MRKLICRKCGRDLNQIYQDNMSYTNEPLCEDCFYGINQEMSDREFYELYESGLLEVLKDD